MVSIIMLSHNLGKITEACVKSIRRNVSIPCEVIVVDNHSDPETLEVLEHLEGIRLIKNAENRGFPAGCNQGLDAARGELVWFLNNDTLVPKGSLERMVQLLESDERIGIVGPLTNRISGKQQIPVEYAFTPGDALEDWSDMEAFAAKLAEENAGQIQRVLRLVGFSMLMRRSDVQALGGFDERMGIGTFEDDSISLKFAAHGYRLLVAKDAFIHHIGSASFRAAGGYPPGGEVNQQTASRTAGMTIPDEVVLNEKMLKYVDENAKRVLHVECGCGAYGLLAEETGIYAEALESSPSKAQIAVNHYQKLTMYTPGEAFKLESDGFDTLLIEKQYESRHTLELVRSVSSALAPKARVIIQLPGITAIRGCLYEACQECWDSDGYWIKRGGFEHLNFVEQMSNMGFDLVLFEQKESKRGFFKRNAFARQQQEAAERGARVGELDFFHEAIYIFEK